jgi:rhodanese-related sulfurtransferase
MKRIITLAFVAISAVLFTQCNAQQPQADVATFEKELKSTGAILVDVRTPQEFAGGHIKGAQNIDIYSDDFGKRMLAFDKSKTILVYCRSGNRSAQAAQFLRQSGYKVVDLAGGVGAWSRAGKSLVND